MLNCSKLCIRKGIIFFIFYFGLSKFAHSIQEFSLSNSYKLGVVTCQGKTESLLGEYEAEKIFNWTVHGNLNDILINSNNKSVLETDKIKLRVETLKVNSKVEDVTHFSPPKSPIKPNEGCVIELAARKTVGGQVLLNPRVWTKLSDDLKEKAYLELAWSEKIGIRARIHLAYLGSDQFGTYNDKDTYDLWTGNHVIDQYFAGLHFKNVYSSRDKDRYFNEISFENLDLKATGDLHSEFLFFNLAGDVKSYGKLIDVNDCEASHPLYPLSECGVDKFVDGEIDEGRVKFPHSEFESSYENCSLDGCFKNLSPTWKVTFIEKEGKTFIDTLTCNSFLRNYVIVDGGGVGGNGNVIPVFKEEYYAALYTCNIELFGQKLEVTKNDLVFYGFGYTSSYDLRVKFLKDQIQLDLPISSAFIKAEKHYYKNPTDGVFYGGPLIINNQGQVVNLESGAVAIRQDNRTRGEK